MKAPKNLYLITDGGCYRNITNLSFQAALIALFLKHDMDEIVTYHSAAGLSYKNYAEQMHSLANLSLQTDSFMRRVMIPYKLKWIKSLNLNEEICKFSEGNNKI